MPGALGSTFASHAGRLKAPFSWLLPLIAAYQRFYENGSCRWGIEYHANGRRASVGFYADREPSEYRADGLHTSYSMDGVVNVQSEWRAGVRHGWTKHWEDDGFPVGATRYEQGIAVENMSPDGMRSRV